jgi:elongation factor G
MHGRPPAPPRAAAIVGPYLSGKTSLLESILFVTGAISRKGTHKGGDTVGDNVPEARARKMGVEVSVARTAFLDEQWNFIDCPGSIEFGQEARNALLVADIAILVCEPVIERALLLAPLFKFLDDHSIPHMVFINKMDNAQTRVSDVLQALQGVSDRPLILRQIPLRAGEDGGYTGYVDLVSERTYKYQPGQASSLIPMPDDAKETEADTRRKMLESLADFDDTLLEQLLEDTVPEKAEIFRHLTRNLHQDRIVPVFFGAAERDNGVRRLLKALRHETPSHEIAAKRAALEPAGEPVAEVFKTMHLPHTGKLSFARIWRGEIAEGAALNGTRVAGIMQMLGAQTTKLPRAGAGEVVAFLRLEGVKTGDMLTPSGKRPEGARSREGALKPLFALSLTAEKRADEVKLTSALARLVEEDPSLSFEQNMETHELLMWGQGEMHLNVAADRLRNRANVAVKSARPQVPYRETIRRPAQSHGRHKRQTGGHGQFADVKVTIEPKERGGGFEFLDEIVGGAIPRNFIPSVEEGIRDYMKRGPLGFPLVDFQVKLYDGQFHDVDSSDMAFRTAGRIAMVEGLPKCEPVLLEPIFKVTIAVPNSFIAGAQRLVTGRRGQILGFEAKPGWPGWDQLVANLPQAEMYDLIVELRSLTMGVGTFEWQFDHMAELTGRIAEKIVSERAAQQGH